MLRLGPRCARRRCKRSSRRLSSFPSFPSFPSHARRSRSATSVAGESGGGLRLDGAGESGGGLRLDGAGESGGGLRLDGAGDRKEALVSETTAARLWPGQSPLGRRFRIGGGGNDSPLLEIVGVVGDVHSNSLSATPRFTVYLPYWQRSGRRVSLAVRTSNAGIAASI